MRRREHAAAGHPGGTRLTCSMVARLSALLLASLAAGCATSRPPPDDMALATGTNRAFAHTVRVQAAPDVVWALWTDVPSWPDWDVELDSAFLDGPFEVGARGRVTPVRGPSSSFRIAELEPGRAYTFETRLPLAVLRIRRSWEPSDAGAIDITHEVSFHGLTAGLFASRFGPTFRAALPVAMERIRQLAEAAP